MPLPPGRLLELRGLDSWRLAFDGNEMILAGHNNDKNSTSIVVSLCLAEEDRKIFDMLDYDSRLHYVLMPYTKVGSFNGDGSIFDYAITIPNLIKGMVLNHVQPDKVATIEVERIRHKNPT